MHHGSVCASLGHPSVSYGHCKHPRHSVAARPGRGTGERRSQLVRRGEGAVRRGEGTGLVAVAGATLPVDVPGPRMFAEVVWVIAAVLLVVPIPLTGTWRYLAHKN